MQYTDRWKQMPYGYIMWVLPLGKGQLDLGQVWLPDLTCSHQAKVACLPSDLRTVECDKWLWNETRGPALLSLTINHPYNQVACVHTYLHNYIWLITVGLHAIHVEILLYRYSAGCIWTGVGQIFTEQGYDFQVFVILRMCVCEGVF